MKVQLQIDRVENCSKWLEEVSEEVQVQSTTWYIERINTFCHSLAFINAQMAIAKFNLNQKKVNAYNTLIASSVANEMYFAPSLAKDYIAGKCAEEQYVFDIAERTSRTLVHIIEAYRSCLSALKEEMKVMSYAGISAP